MPIRPERRLLLASACGRRGAGLIVVAVGHVSTRERALAARPSSETVGGRVTITAAAGAHQ